MWEASTIIPLSSRDCYNQSWRVFQTYSEQSTFPNTRCTPSYQKKRHNETVILTTDLNRQLSSNANQNHNVFNHWSTKIEQNPELLATNLFCILSIWRLKLTNEWVGWQIQTPLTSDIVWQKLLKALGLHSKFEFWKPWQHPRTA